MIIASYSLAPTFSSESDVQFFVPTGIISESSLFRFMYSFTVSLTFWILLLLIHITSVYFSLIFHVHMSVNNLFATLDSIMFQQIAARTSNHGVTGLRFFPTPF